MKLWIKDKKEIMKHIKENWHWCVTAVWIGFIVYLWRWSGIGQPEELNGVGDFLAGAFAPLAFFWLVRGFYQQGEGLRQNSEALALQANELRASSQALALQAKEMKATVEQQKLMAELQNLEIEERHNAAFPIIDLSVVAANTVQGKGFFNFHVKNKEDVVARSLTLQTNIFDSMHSGNSYSIPYLGRETRNFSEEFTEQENELYKMGTPFERHVDIHFENIYGRKYYQSYLIQVTNNEYSNNIDIQRLN